MPIISVNNLTKTYSSYKKQPGLINSLKGLFKRETIEVRAVKDVSFTIEEGEFVGFLGPNGAGKTTTLKMLSGILYPTSGEATVLGYTPWKRQAAFQKQFALVMGQKNQLWWDLPATESFLLNKEIYEVPDEQYKKTLDELVELLQIKHILDIPVRKLSLGERMKCELVAALLHSPKVLFLDEPTIGLDVVSQQNIREFLKKYNRETKTTVILTSHYMEDVEALCERVILIGQGEKMYDGSLKELVSQYVTYKLIDVRFTEEVVKERLETFGILKEYSGQRAVIEVSKKEVKKVAVELMTKFPVDDLLINDVDVEEVIRTVFTEMKH